MKPTCNTAPFMTTSLLRDCVRAAEADAGRFHGARAPRRAPDRWRVRAPMLATGALLLMAAAWLLSPAPERETVRAPARAPAHDNGVHRLPFDAAPAAAPSTKERRPALTATVDPETVDGGDVDIALAMPASVLTTSDGLDTPRVASMNVPTVPDAFDTTAGEAEAAP